MSARLVSHLVADGALGPRALSSVPLNRRIGSSRTFFTLPYQPALALPPQKSRWLLSLVLSPLYCPGQVSISPSWTTAPVLLSASGPHPHPHTGPGFPSKQKSDHLSVRCDGRHSNWKHFVNVTQKLLSRRHIRGGLGGLAAHGFLEEAALGSLKPEGGRLAEVGETGVWRLRGRA